MQLEGIDLVGLRAGSGEWFNVPVSFFGGLHVTTFQEN